MTDRPPLRSVVIGCGAIAAEHFKFLGSSKLTELVGVCDRSEASAAFAQQRSGAKQAFTDADVMLSATKPDVVHILTPPQTHATLVRRSLDADAHVICEKPMAATADETAALLGLAKQKGKALFESRNYMWNDVVIRICKLIRDGRLGEVREVDLLLSLDFLSGPFGDLNLAGPGVDLPAGAIHDFLPHLAYLFLEFSGHRGEVSDVRGYLENMSGNSRAGFDHLDALVRAGKKRGRLRVAVDIEPPSFRVFVRGSTASVEADLFNPFVLVQGPPDVGKRTALGQIRNGATLAKAGIRNFRDKVLQHGPYHGLPRMLEALYRHLRDGGDAPITEADMIATARLSDRIVALKSE